MEASMPEEVQVGTILMKEWPMTTQLLGPESGSYSGNWSVIKALDGLALDRKIRAAGWSFFFMATEVKVMFFGAVRAKSIQKALKRILGKVSYLNFNSLEVTGIVPKRFLGVPYAIVSAHSRHVQQNCHLDSAEERRAAQRDRVG
jgi:hypothetical protein